MKAKQHISKQPHSALQAGAAEQLAALLDESSRSNPHLPTSTLVMINLPGYEAARGAAQLRHLARELGPVNSRKGVGRYALGASVKVIADLGRTALATGDGDGAVFQCLSTLLAGEAASRLEDPTANTLVLGLLGAARRWAASVDTRTCTGSQLQVR